MSTAHLAGSSLLSAFVGHVGLSSNFRLLLRFSMQYTQLLRVSTWELVTSGSDSENVQYSAQNMSWLLTNFRAIHLNGQAKQTAYASGIVDSQNCS